ncbi:uncharacterized protein METZ01_LOCUS379715, partial [marine metagenome]
IPQFTIYCLLLMAWLGAQTHFAADPYYLLLVEKSQFQGQLPLSNNLFRPVFINTDTLAVTFTMRNEGYYNDNAPNQENMDVRYFSKGFANFSSVQLAINSPYFSFLAEPYLMTSKSFATNGVSRGDHFSVLNDVPLSKGQLSNSPFRNLLAFIHYKGFGFGWHMGNRWWGPGIHTSLEMTNNTYPIPAQVLGTVQEIRIGSIGFFGQHTLARLNETKGVGAKYLTALNGQFTWYGPVILTAGFSRVYLSGGIMSAGGYVWKEKDARLLVFEGIFTSNLMENDYTIGGHDSWDQTLSG